MKKLKRGSKCNVAFCDDPVLASNLYDGTHNPPNLDDELNSLRRKDKSFPAEDTKQVILASAPSKPYTCHKDEVLSLLVSLLPPNRNGQISYLNVKFSSQMVKKYWFLM